MEIRANETVTQTLSRANACSRKSLEFESLVRIIEDPRENFISVGYFSLIINDLRNLQTNQTE